MSGLAAVVGATAVAGAVVPAGAVTLPPNPCVTSAVHCVLGGLAPAHGPVLRNPTAPCDATCGVSPRRATVRRG